MYASELWDTEALYPGSETSHNSSL